MRKFVGIGLIGFGLLYWQSETSGVVNFWEFTELPVLSLIVVQLITLGILWIGIRHLKSRMD